MYWEIKFFLMYCIDEDENDELSISRTPVYEIIQSLCEDSFVPYFMIKENIIKIYGKDYNNLIDKFLLDLIDNGILVSELDVSPLDKDPLSTILKVLKDKVGNEDEDSLEEINYIESIINSINNYNYSQFGMGIDLFNEITKKMSDKLEWNNYLQVDTLDLWKLKLPKKIKYEIEEFATYLQYISDQKRVSYIDVYKEKFIEKYGLEQEIPIVELFDTGIGLGAPFNYTRPSNDFFEHFENNLKITDEEESIYLRLFVEAIKNNGDIDISECNELIKDNINYEHIVPSLELYFKLQSYDKEIKLQLNNIVGCNDIGSSFGRFANRFPKIDEVYEKLVKIDNSKYEKNSKIVELGIIPDKKSDTNVLRTVNYRDLELNFYCRNESLNDEILLLKNILIGVNHKGFYAIDRKTNKKLIFKKTNMYNIDLLPNELKFLLEISYNNYINWTSFPWLIAYSKMTYIPKIKYKNIVLSPRQWKIKLDNIDGISTNDYKNVEESISKYFIKSKIPKRFLMVFADHEILYDLNRSIDKEVFAITLKKLHRKYGNNAVIQLFEDEKNEKVLYDQEGNVFSLEVVVPLINNKIESYDSRLFYLKKPRVEKEKRELIPFDEWLYLKLYMKSNLQDEFIAMQLDDLLNLGNKKLEYFYIRYADPKPHLRVRIKGSSEELMNNYYQISQKLKILKNQHIVNNIIIDTYDREIERYGGIEVFQSVENLFILDSHMSQKLLSMYLDEGLDIDKNIISLRLNYNYIKNFYSSFDDVKEYFSIIGVNKISGDSSLKADKENYIKLFDNDENKVFKIIDEEFCKHKELIKNINTKMVKLNINTYEKAKIVDSIIHMNNNRIIGINRDIEKEIMEIVRSILIREFYIKK